MINKILDIKNLGYKVRKTQILNNCSISIAKGDFHGLIGENGSGKSTIMNIIAGLTKPTNGLIHFKNKNIFTMNDKSILFIPERLVFPKHLNVMNYLKNFSEMFLNEEVSKSSIIELLKKFDIDNKIYSNVNKLSSGQKKKVTLIYSIITKPEFLILDEPAANLDPTTRMILFNELKKMNQKGTTILISSHIIEELKKFVNSATLIKKGEIAWSGALEGKQDLIHIYKKIILRRV